MIIHIITRLTTTSANNFSFAFLASYGIDLFVIEIILIVVKIVTLPDIEQKIRSKDTPIIYNLLFFMLSVGTSGARGGFF